MAGNDIVNMLRRFRAESGMDERIDLRALQAVGLVRGDRKLLRVWFNDGRIREWDCSRMIADGKGRLAGLRDPEVFLRAVTVWDGAPGFDLAGRHDADDCLDFDPYDVWTSSTDVTRQVLQEESQASSFVHAAEESPAYGQ